MTESILVLDVGGTKLAAAIMLPDNRLVCRQEAATLAETGGPAVFARLVTLATTVLRAYAQSTTSARAPLAVGLASAGYIDPATGNVLFATENLPGWTGMPLAEMLAERFGVPAFAANDAACFALAEANLGAGQGYGDVLVVAVGTGLGGGIVRSGELYGGWQGRAGAIGHLCVEPTNGRPCTCGLQGCLESYTATRIMVAESGYESIHELAQQYGAGNEEPAVEEAAIWLGRGLAAAAHLLGPEAIVVGGSVGLLGERFLDTVAATFRNQVMPIYASIPVLPAHLAADSGLLGAGLFVRRSLASQPQDVMV